MDDKALLVYKPQELSDWLPVMPMVGPPLPKFLEIWWPWFKPELPLSVVPPVEPVEPEEEPPSDEYVPPPYVPAEPFVPPDVPGDYVPPDFIPPDNDPGTIYIPTESGSVTITDDSVVIIGGAWGWKQTFYRGSKNYDIYVTYYRAIEAGMVDANFDYTKNAVNSFYSAVSRYGTDLAVENMSSRDAKYWAAIERYCPFTYLPTAEAKYKEGVEEGEISPQLEAAFIAAKEADAIYHDFIKAKTFTNALEDYEAGVISKAEYEVVLSQWLAVKKYRADAIAYYRSLGGTKFI